MNAARGTVLEFTAQVTPTGQLILPADLTLPAEFSKGLAPGQAVRVMVVVMPPGEDPDQAAWHHMASLQLARLSDADLVPQDS